MPKASLRGEVLGKNLHFKFSKWVFRSALEQNLPYLIICTQLRNSCFFKAGSNTLKVTFTW